jgi:putative DNA primase/helicase
LGKANVAAVSLHKLESDCFVAARLLGKLANIAADLPSEHLAGTSIFKMITGGDVLTGERKYESSFDFVPFARLLFSANHPPRSSDSSQGFFDRWLVVPFARGFRGSEQEIPRPVLDARLAAPPELSGVLNRALDALEAMERRGGGFTESASIRAAYAEFRDTTDPVAVWLDVATLDAPDMLVTKAQLLAAFNAEAERAGRPALTPTAFGRALRRLRPNLMDGQRTVGSKLQWVWIGLWDSCRGR